MAHPFLIYMLTALKGSQLYNYYLFISSKSHNDNLRHCQILNSINHTSCRSNITCLYKTANVVVHLDILLVQSGGDGGKMSGMKE